MANKNSKNKANNKKKNTSTNKENVNKKVVVKEENKKVEEKIVKEEKVEKEVVVKKESKEKKSFALTSKQKDIILVLLVVVLLVILFVVSSVKTPKLDIELPVLVEGSGYNELTYADYEAKINNKEPFIVAIVNDGCGYCEAYEPIMKEVSDEEGVPLYYINLAHLTSEESSLLSSSNSYLRTKKWGTPTTLFLYGDTVVDSLGGYVEKDTLVSFVKENIKVDVNNEE